ncbi:MAG: transglycosylase domain-containing protein, partial [Hyphomicrobiaceae bacterium]
MTDGQQLGHSGDPAKPAPKPVARRWRKLRLLGYVGLAGAIATMVLLSIQFIRYTIEFPDPRALSMNEAGPVIRRLGRDGPVLAEPGQKNQFVKLDQLPPHLVNAVVATEDRRFFDHWGVDPSGLLRAAFANLRAGRTVQGGSTLTQQLAKNLFLTTDRTLSRKLDELVLSLWLELRLSKHDILELYLNRVYFGGGAYGVEAAAQRYFHKSARRLTVGEAAVIAGLLKAPTRYSPFNNPGFARARARVVLRAMQDAGFLGQAAYTAASRYSVRFATQDKQKRQTGYEYAVDYVLDRLPPVASVGNRTVLVQTTFDPTIQRLAQATMTHALIENGKPSRVGQGAMVVMDPAGGLRALVGGKSFTESQFDRAVRSRRQPGSAFKPFVYMSAIEQGMSPRTLINDAPVEIDGWTPHNSDDRYRGQITLGQALARSVNTVAVRLQQEVGANTVASMAQRLGIKSTLRPDGSLALGTSEVNLLELTGAYGVLASGGREVAPYAIQSISLDDGQVIYQHQAPKARQLLAPSTIEAMNEMLSGTLVFGTGKRAALRGQQAAGKTGTSQDYRDAWFLGYTSYLVGGVWLGNDDGKPMNKVYGGGLPAEIWKSVMQSAHAGLSPRALPGMDNARPPKLVPPIRPVALHAPAEPTPVAIAAEMRTAP